MKLYTLSLLGFSFELVVKSSLFKYFNAVNNQKVMSLNIYEGEKKYVKYNHLIKEIKISGLTPREIGKTVVWVTFEIDINGILYFCFLTHLILL